MDRWPNFFIVGADKAGTSSLYSYLKEISEIFMSPIKEPNYFSAKTIPQNSQLKPIRDKKKYLDLFKNVKDEKILGDASPSYLRDPEAANLIHQVSPDAKILISLRDPVDRFFSHYLMSRRLGKIQSTLYSKIQAELNKEDSRNNSKLLLYHGLYYEDVKRYVDIFGSTNVKIIIFEEFIKNEKITIENILKFLNLKNNLENFKPEIYNKYGVARNPISQKILQSGKIRRMSEKLISPSKRRILKEKLILKEEEKPKMEEKEKILLINYYRDDVQKLKNLLGKKLPWKNFLNDFE